MVEKIATILDTKGHGIYSVPLEATAHEAISLMAEKTVGAVLVLDEGSLEGIVSAKDYGSRVVLRGRSARETPVREIMSSPVVTVADNATVFECMAIMTKNHIRHLPVVRDTELVGVVSMGDLANAVIADQAFKIDQLMTYVGHH